MTKLLLIIVVIAMFVLTGLAAYESYRSLQENAGQGADEENSDIPQFEVQS